MVKKKLLVSLLGAAMVASLVSGCGGGKKSGKKTVGIAMPTKTLERWNRDGSYLEKQFKDKGYDVSLKFSDNKIDQQVKDIEGLIADDVDLLVIAAIDGESLTKVLDDAKEEDIPVISYDRLIRNTEAVSYYVSFDNYRVGQLQGEFVRDQLDLDNAAGPFNIEFTAGDPADNNAGFFFNGAFDTLKPYIDSGKLVIKSGQNTFDQVATKAWDTATAMTRFQNILGSNYSSDKLDVALCSNDSTALGVAQAIETDYNQDNKADIIVTGQDGDEANLKNMVDGKQTMTVYKAVANEAVATLDLGEKLLKGEKPDAKLIDDAGWKFTCKYDTESYDNGKKKVPSYLLEPTIVTKENMDKELVDTGYYTKDDQGYLHPKN
ncbi:putative multiple sugar transport system substrate-binding protein [Eubacterium uniforme]|uniref:Putative multiple sugar transport system substrate-binding protein n=1 Tax=Eubacterium uniforme TaxID=39495 RepID=A0A1T4W490_9FIRM|nr:putative multiple sugar transport system substrate-binding protein [Eubacterium uniforme]